MTWTRDRLELHMVEAKARLIKRGREPKVFWLTPEHHDLLNQGIFDGVPVRKSTGKLGSRIYCTAGTSVMVPQSLTRKEYLR